MKHTSKYITSLLAFTTGFTLFALSANVFSATVDTDTISTKLHSVDIAGGYTDPNDDTGMSIENNGRVLVDASELTGSTLSNFMQFAWSQTANKMGLNTTGIHHPVAGRNITELDGNLFGRVGVEGILSAIDSTTGNPATMMAYVGYLKSTNVNENNAQTHTSPITDGEVYGFYTGEGATHLGNTTIEGVLSSPDNNVLDFVGDVQINGDLTVQDVASSATDTTLFFQNAPEFRTNTYLDARFGAMHNSTYSGSVTLGPDNTFTSSVACPNDTYVIDCSGRVVGAPNHAPYRGSYHWYKSNMEGGGCQARARKPSTSNVILHVYAYCYAPHDTIPNWDTD